MTNFHVEPLPPIKGDIDQDCIKKLGQAILSGSVKYIMKDTVKKPWTVHEELAEYNLDWCKSSGAMFWCDVLGIDHERFVKEAVKTSKRSKEENYELLTGIRKKADRVNSRLKNGAQNKIGYTNRVKNRPVTHDGRTQTISEWSKELGLVYATVVARFARGLTVEMAFYKGNLRRFSQ
jgi:hypothetical protein